MITGEAAALRSDWQSYGYALVRFAAGITIMAHGYPKVFTTGVAGLAAGVISKIGLPGNPLYWGYAVMVVEFGGGLLLALGLFTRLAALALLGEFIVIVFIVKFANGFFAFAASAIQPGFAAMVPGGFELELMLGIICLACLIGGGGSLSIDAALSGRRPATAIE